MTHAARTLLLALALLACTGAHSATLYLCEQSPGRTFWSAYECRQVSAFAVQAYQVPNGLSLQQQIDHVLSGPVSCAAVTAGTAPIESGSALAPPRSGDADLTTLWRRECRALERRVAEIDQITRQTLSGPATQCYRDERRNISSRIFSLHCNQPRPPAGYDGK